MSEDELQAALARAAAQEDVKDASDWRRSIVDLLKILRMDSEFKARSQLAKELGYSGSYDGSIAANMWLHKEVMSQVRKHLIVVPGDHD